MIEERLMSCEMIDDRQLGGTLTLVLGICAFSPFPFKGKVGMGMGFSRVTETADCVTIIRPHPNPSPLTGRGLLVELRVV
jgi:hypothetical protein